MPRLISPAGVIVSVSDEKAQRLLNAGYSLAPVEKQKEDPVDLTPKRRPRTTRKTNEEG